MQIVGQGHLISKGASGKLVGGSFGVDLVWVLVYPFDLLRVTYLGTKKVEGVWP